MTKTLSLPGYVHCNDSVPCLQCILATLASPVIPQLAPPVIPLLDKGISCLNRLSGQARQ